MQAIPSVVSGGLSQHFRQVGASSTSSEPTAPKKLYKVAGLSRMAVREDLLDFFNTFGVQLDARDVRPSMVAGYKHPAAWWLQLDSEQARKVEQLSESPVV